MVALQPGDVIFVKRMRDPTLKDRIIGKLVKWATRSEYSHVAYFVAQNITFEANAFRRAGFGSMNDYSEFDVKRLSFDPDVRMRILKRIQQVEGSPYGWGEVFALLFRKRFGVPIYFDSLDGFECAELLVKAAYEETGIRIIEQTTGDVSPQDLWESAYLEGV